MAPRTMHLTLDGGMDQSTYERHVQPPAVLDAVNVRYHRSGGVEKRPGCTKVADGFSGFVAGGGKLIASGDELLLTDGYQIATEANGAFVVKDKVPEAIPELLPIAGSAFGMSQPQIAYSSGSGGYLVYAWSSSASYGTTGEIVVTVQDATSGAELASSLVMTDGAGTYTEPRVVSVGTTVFLVYQTTANIYYRTYDRSTNTWSAQAILTSALASNSVYDVCGTASWLYLTYRAVAGNIVVAAYPSTISGDHPGGGHAASSTEAATNTTAFGMCATAGELVWIVYHYASGGSTFVRAVGFTDSGTVLTETVAPGTVYSEVTTVDAAVRCVPCRISSTQVCILISTTTADGQSVMAPVWSSSGAIVGGASGPARRAYWSGLGSRPFVASTSPLRVYAWLISGGARYTTPSVGEQALQYSAILCDLGCDDTTSDNLPPRPVFTEGPRFTVGALLDSPPAPANVGSKWHAPLLQIASGQHLNIVRSTADFAHANRFATCELARCLFMAPGHVWDRGRLFEQGYCYWPQKPSTPTFSSASGHLTAGGTYRRRVLYEWIDNNGYRHQSEPSDVLEFTVDAGHDTATYKAPALTLTSKCDAASGFAPSVSIVVYGTTDISDTAGGDPNTYYRVFSIDATPLNDVLAESVTVVDKGNVNLTLQAQLYTEGGVLPNVQPRGCQVCAAYRDRVWIAYGATINYSKAFVEGDAVSFTDAFELPLEQNDPITAMWVMDDRLFISTETRLYWLAADGPADNDVGNDVTTPNRVATNWGCADQRSVIVTPVGTFFQSRRGLELLERERLTVTPAPIGARMQRELDAFPTITSATMHPDASGGWVTFTLVGATTGERFAFDYGANKWSRDEVLKSGSGAGATSKKIVSAAVRGTTTYFLTSLGSVYQEADTADDTALDDGSWVEMKVRTAWVHTDGLQGYQFVRKALWMGDKSTSHDLAITPYFDYSSTPGTGFTFTATGGSKPLDSMPIPQVAVMPTPQRCQAVSWEIADSTPTGATVGTGRGSLFAGLALEIESEGTSAKLPAAQKG